MHSTPPQKFEEGFNQRWACGCKIVDVKCVGLEDVERFEELEEGLLEVLACEFTEAPNVGNICCS
jgi:hypothetical protein